MNPSSPPVAATAPAPLDPASLDSAPLDPESQLRPYRKAMVENAEQVMEAAFRERWIKLNNDGTSKLKKSQLNHLIGICGQAEVDAEIKNYLRYQAGRGEHTTGWSIELVKHIIEAADRAMNGLQDDALRVSAWKLFATYLTRAFTYQEKIQKPKNPGGGYVPGRGASDRGGRGGRS